MPILFIIYPVINVKSYLASWYHFALYLILSFPEFCTWAELFSNEITMKSEEKACLHTKNIISQFLYLVLYFMALIFYNSIIKSSHVVVFYDPSFIL